MNKMKKKIKVAVVGGGIFGVSISLFLSDYFEVHLFEKNPEIMGEACTNNHFRHHYGYHYPRSKKTARECIESRKEFEAIYGESVLEKFPNYYSITKEGSLVSGKEYIDFCESLNLDYEIVDPDPSIIDPEMVELTLKVPEVSYNPEKLREICINRLNESQVNLRKNTLVFGGEIKGDVKEIKFDDGKNTEKESFDYVVNATYSGYNVFCKSFGLEPAKLQYEVMELLEFSLDRGSFGCMNMDGPFASIMPKNDKGIFSVAHAEESVRERFYHESDNEIPSVPKEIKSNSENIIRESAKHFPILNSAKNIKSIFVVKVVKADVDNTDERPTEIFDHGNGIFSVLAGKVATSISVSKNILERINKDISNTK